MSQHINVGGAYRNVKDLNIPVLDYAKYPLTGTEKGDEEAKKTQKLETNDPTPDTGDGDKVETPEVKTTDDPTDEGTPDEDATDSQDGADTTNDPTPDPVELTADDLAELSNEELKAKYKEVKGKNPRKDLAENNQRLITQILS